MEVYVALLRGINVSGHRSIRMADLRAMMTKLGFKNVKTYLQSGNVIFETEGGEAKELEKLIGAAVRAALGHDVKVLVRERETFLGILEHNPFLDATSSEVKKLYYILFLERPEAKAFEELMTGQDFPERAVLTKEALYVYYVNGYGRSRLNSNYLERKLGVWATARNHNTMKNLSRLLKEAS